MKRPYKTHKRSFVEYKVEERQNKLLTIINKYFGESASLQYKYNVQKLETQALSLMKLEDNESYCNNKLPNCTSSYMVKIIAACCYLQTKQVERWEIPMSDYISVCKFMNVPKPGLGLKLIQKWADQLGFDRTRIREGGKASNETLVKRLEQNVVKKIDQTKKVEKSHIKN